MKDLTKGNETSLIFKFALPMLLGNIFQQLCHVINTWIVGNYISADAMASVGASFLIMFLLIAMVFGIGMGCTVVVSQYFGAKKLNLVKKAVDTSLIFLTGSGVLVGIIGFIFGESILKLTQLDAKLIPDALLYLQINMVGMVGTFGYTAVASVLRGMGDSIRPLYLLIFSTIINLILDILFVIVFDWGIAGVAWATVIAYFVSFISAMIYLNKTHPLLRYSFKTIQFDWDIFKTSARIGLPSGFQQTFVALGGIALMTIVNGFGKDILTSYTIAGRIDMFIAMPAMNLAAALSAFVGQNLALKNYQRIKKGLWATMSMSIGICLILTIAMILIGDDLIKLFMKPNEPNYQFIVNEGHKYLVIVCSFYPFVSAMFVLNGLLRGAGATFIPMLVTLLSLWLVRVPLAYYLSQVLQLGPTGVWWSIPIGWLLGLTGSWIYYSSGKWKKEGVEIDANEY